MAESIMGTARDELGGVLSRTTIPKQRFCDSQPKAPRMQRRKGGKRRRQRDDEEEERPRKRGKEEADEDDDIFGYGATDPARGEKWTEEQDLRVSWLRFERRTLVLRF